MYSRLPGDAEAACCRKAESRVEVQQSFRLEALGRRRTCQRMIRQDKLSAAIRDDSQRFTSDKTQQAGHRRVVGNDVRPPRLKPQLLELRVVDENIGRSGGIRAVKHVVEAAV